MDKQNPRPEGKFDALIRAHYYKWVATILCDSSPVMRKLKGKGRKNARPIKEKKTWVAPWPDEGKSI